MTARIIDNKKIELTDSEFALYEEIARSYDGARFNGKDLFKGLFETDDDGRIILLRPPMKNQSSLEVYLYLSSVMIHQHLRDSVNSHDAMLASMKIENEKTKELQKELEIKLIELQKIIDSNKKDIVD